MIKHLDEIVSSAVARGRKRLAVAYGQDTHTIEAVYNAWKDGLVEPTLFGDKATIEKACQDLDIDVNVFKTSTRVATWCASNSPCRPW